MQTRWRITKNAIANLLRGGAAGLAALLLPAFLVRYMSQAEYGVWVLVLQIAAYASYLNFGLQTAVGRYVAFANEKKDDEQRNSIFSTALLGLSIAGIFAFCILLIIAFAAYKIFPGIPASLIAKMRLAVIITGASISLSLPTSAWEGLFIGLQMYEVPAILTGAARLISALGLIVAGMTGHSIVTMAAILATVNISSYAAEYFWARKVAPEVKFQKHLIHRSSVRELGGYCFSLSVWSFSTMLVTGLDLVLVGRFQFRALAAYGIAASLVSFIAGSQGAIFGTIMPHAAVIHAQQDSAKLGRMVLTATRLGVLLLLLTGLPLMIYALPLLRLWVGSDYAAQGYRLLVILLIANMIRLIGTPYAAVLIGTGQQKQVLVSPLAEGLTNLSTSIFLGYHYGAIGVAIGTLIGACVSIAAHLWYSMPRTCSVIGFTRYSFIVSSVLMPILFTIPLGVIAIFSLSDRPLPPYMVTAGFLLTTVGAISVLHRSGIRPSILGKLSWIKL
jgi:O-antigen/teichoic acid export membrane protein